MKKKVAIVYDWIDKWGGVERILIQLHEMFPEAPFFTSYVDIKSALWARNIPINTTFIQKFPNFIKKNRVLSVPFYPYAFENLNFSSYDCVVTVSSSFAKGIITKPEAKHILYLLTPSRFLWTSEDLYLSHHFMKKTGSKYKRWDFAAAQRADRILSLSESIRQKCNTYYKRASEVLYPPFDYEYWSHIKSKIKNQKSKIQLKNQKYFLVVSRFEPYKRVDLVVDVFNENGKPLVLVGKGTLEGRLKREARENIAFLSDLSDSELAWLYTNAQALIAPQEEDFGYVFLESLFFGLPVIAFKRGGATEILDEGKTALFFENQSANSLSQTLERYIKISYNLKKSSRFLGRKMVKKYDNSKFKSRFFEIVNTA